MREFLRAQGCVYVKTEGGHEKWNKAGLTRPIIIQTHIDPIPEFIVKNILRNLGATKDQFFEFVKKS